MDLFVLTCLSFFALEQFRDRVMQNRLGFFSGRGGLESIRFDRFLL